MIVHRGSLLHRPANTANRTSPPHTLHSVLSIYCNFYIFVVSTFRSFHSRGTFHYLQAHLSFLYHNHQRRIQQHGLLYLVWLAMYLRPQIRDEEVEDDLRSIGCRSQRRGGDETALRTGKASTSYIDYISVSLQSQLVVIRSYSPPRTVSHSQLPTFSVCAITKSSIQYMISWRLERFAVVVCEAHSHYFCAYRRTGE